MSGFVGSFPAKVDPKGRLSLPSKLRQSSDVSLEVCYLTLGLNGCLFLLPRAEWQRVMARFDNYNFADEDANFFMRKLMANTFDVVPDAQSRILVPPKLAAVAGITDGKRDVLLLGMNRRCEIWLGERFESYLSGYGKTYEEVAAKLLL
ncbi:MAG: hypothetical protein HY304_00865 [candidate division Zixibacteria bacterium]|nr:hypothetical protein [candidate division Zixibacteria bacterium]